MSRLLLTAASTSALISSSVTYDYYVSSDAEWASVFANSDATLSGKTIGVIGSNFSRRTLAPRNFSSTTRIRSVDANAKLPGIDLSPCNNLCFDNLNMQYPNWPKADPGIIRFLNGNHNNFQMIGGNYRHGYGPTHQDFIRDFLYPEMVPGKHNLTATTTSQTFPLLWQTTGQGGEIVFFNDGSSDVFARLVDLPTDVATSTDVRCPAGQMTRFSQGTKPYIALLAESGSVPCFVRADVGLGKFITSLFFSEGGANLVNPKMIGVNTFDLAEAFRNMHLLGECVFMDLNIRRTYSDIFAAGFPDNDTSSLYWLRNTYDIPFALAGITTRINDAGDPHGDEFQLYNGAFVGRRIYCAGNVSIVGNVRPGVSNQGKFLQNNSYEDMYVIGDIMMGGNKRGISVSGPSKWLVAYGCTISSWELFPGGSDIIMASASGDSYVARNLASAFPVSSQVGVEQNVGVPYNNIKSVFPNWDNLRAANTRIEMEAAVAAGGPATGIGAPVVSSEVVNFTTTDHTQVIRWNVCPAFIEWPDTSFLDINTVFTSDIRKVKGPFGTLPITAIAGTEYRVLADQLGTTVVTNWTSSPGTVDRGQFVQIRGTTSSFYQTSKPLSISINGFSISMNMVTKAADPVAFWTSSAAGPGFVDTTATMAGNNGDFTIAFKLRIPVSTASCTLAQMTAPTFTLELMSGGSLRQTMRDNGNTSNIISSKTVAGAGSILTGLWHDIVVSVSLSQHIYRLWINGVLKQDITDLANVQNIFPTSRVLNLMQTVAWGGRLTGNVASLKFWKNLFTSDGTLPISAPYKTIEGDANYINTSEPWKAGANAT